MMYKPLYLTLLLCATYCCRAQTTDQFSDGNFSTNPTWVGDDSLFQVNASLQLQSKGTTPKDISLATSITPFTEMEWQCWAKFNLSPSASNLCRYYLYSDVTNLKGSVNGYYIQLGGVTGNTDSITLYKQTGLVRTRIIAGRPATVAKNTNSVRFKVLRDNVGNWQLFSDTTGGTSFVLEGLGQDSAFSPAGFSGVFVRYTSGNANNYFFDDVYIGPKIIDTRAPTVDSILVLSATQLRLVFSEAVDSVTALSANHYSISNGIGTPSSVALEPGKTNVVILYLGVPLTNQSYELSASGIADLNGNISSTQLITFVYDHYIAQENDIVISEFFPDPTPPIGLPEKEFVELYNRTNHTINLAGWSISDGTTTAILNNATIAADSFIILCASPSVADFSPFGKVAALNSLPSLNNTSDQILIKDATGKIIHNVRYDLGWYANTSKQDGGYTIEMNNPEQLCLEKQNYAASDNPQGGTPGMQNSRWNKDADTTAPFLKHVIVIDSLSLALVFTERMDSSSLLAANITLVNNTVVNKNVSLSHDSLTLYLAQPLPPNKSNTVTVNNARDCSGNTMVTASNTFTHFVPERAHQFDVLINEIMPDPDPAIQLPNAEYIELFNHSNKFISLKDWTISDISSTAVLPSFILHPDSFLVLTTSSNSIHFQPAVNILGVAGFPSLGNDGDAITLKDESGRVIHHLIYSSNAYKDNLKKNGGWSLELLDPQNPCGGDYNLASSLNPRGGTPGLTNSINHTARDNTAPKLTKVYPLSNTQLQLQFSEQMDSLSLLSPTHYQSDLITSFPTQIHLFAPDYKKVELVSSDSFRLKTIYRLLIDSVKDCAGNVIGPNNYADFGIPETLDTGDIAINELLFDPRGDGSDFVEIINRTDKMLDLKNVLIANADEQNNINEFYPVDSTGWLLFPGTYAVFTENPASLKLNYVTPNAQNIIQTKLPSFPNDEGRCVLVDVTGKRFDQLDYTDNMHFPLLDTKDGVSLERISFNRPSTDVSNWTSASSTSGFATPTYQNSQYTMSPADKNILTIYPEVFSPDGDGFNDHITFSYSLPESGYTANVYIYSAEGTMVKHLLRNELLGTSGSFGWDGIITRGDKAPIGIYLYYFEAFNLKGDVVKTKSTLVVGAKLE